MGFHHGRVLSSTFVLVGVATLLLAPEALAQRRGRNRVPAPNAQLAASSRLTCSFTVATNAVWKDGSPTATVQNASLPPSITFTNIDVEDGTADAGAGFNSEDIIVKLAGSTLHFLDIALDGTLGVITVFARETHDGRLQAVYSRTAYVTGRGGSGAPEAAQFYGDCAADQ